MLLLYFSYNFRCYCFLSLVN